MQRSLPQNARDSSAAPVVACFLARRILAREPALLLRYGDTGGRIVSRPGAGTPEYAYLQAFLGATVTPRQVDWLARRIEASAKVADVIGLRTDLLGPDLPRDFFDLPDGAVRARLASLYPLRPVDRESLPPDACRRLAETRRMMERLPFQPQALFTDAWVHLGLAETGFIAALLRDAPAVSIVTSMVRRELIERLTAALPGRLRVFECPAYPAEEARWAGDHGYLWQRWIALVDSIAPIQPGEPLLISAGIWTKVIGPVWRERGGVAIDFGSVMDFFAGAPSRPAVLATQYADAKTVPERLSIDSQLQRTERLADFLDDGVTDA